MLPSNRVTISPLAFADIYSMQGDVRRQAHGLIVTLASAPSIRRDGSIDFGMQTPDGFVIWVYQDDDFWLYFTEEDDSSLTILRIWER